LGRGTINLPEANTFKGGWKITYCMSDIHGDLDRFQKMLKEIAFSDADVLYVLGDVIDYRIGGVAILSQIMQATNMTLIRGDHEQMCLDALGPDGSLRRRSIWYHYGGHPTFLELRHSFTEPEQADILQYLAGSPDHVEVEVNHRCFYLVHGLPSNDTRTRLWGHPSSSMAAPLSGCTAVVGHTPTPILNGPLDDPYMIWHGNGIIGIDCGCEGSDDLRKLACLRLEDLAEFYA